MKQFVGIQFDNDVRFSNTDKMWHRVRRKAWLFYASFGNTDCIAQSRKYIEEKAQKSQYVVLLYYVHRNEGYGYDWFKIMTVLKVK